MWLTLLYIVSDIPSPWALIMNVTDVGCVSSGNRGLIGTSIHPVVAVYSECLQKLSFLFFFPKVIYAVKLYKHNLPSKTLLFTVYLQKY